MTRSKSQIRYRSNGSAYTPGMSAVRCEICDVPFMAGCLPSDNVLVCHQCREHAAAGQAPGLFDVSYVRPSQRRGERGGDSDPT